MKPTPSLERAGNLMRSPTCGSRTRQRGYSEALVPLVKIFAYGALVVIAVTFILSLVLPIRLLKGKIRIAVVSMVIVTWAVLFWRNIVEPKLDRNWRMATLKECEDELPNIPESIEVDGFLDEGAAIRMSKLLKLFSERRLSFVEIRARQSSGNAPHIVYSDGGGELHWSLVNPRTSLVRLELGKDDDPACAKLPYGLEGRIKQPPFLPNTCIKLTYLDAPTARYMLALQPAETQPLRKRGSWQIVDRLDGQVIASLATVDRPPRIGAAWDYTVGAKRFVIECQAPHTVLVDRFRAPRLATAPPSLQVLSTERIQANTDVTVVSTSSTESPKVAANAEEAFWTEAEEKMLFSPTSSEDAWREAVATARKLGRGPFGSMLLDWKAQKLVALDITKQENPYPWQVFSDGSGFFAVSTSPSWYERNSNLLVRYRSDGTLAWSVRVLTPSTSKRACWLFWPRAVYITSSHLVLAAACRTLSPDKQREAGKKIQGERWFIPLSALPRTS